MPKYDYILISEEEYETNKDNGIYAHYLYFLNHGFIMSVTGKPLNPKFKERKDIIADAVSKLGYIEGNEFDIYFTTKLPLLKNQQSDQMAYIHISITDESLFDWFQSADSADHIVED